MRAAIFIVNRAFAAPATKHSCVGHALGVGGRSSADRPNDSVCMDDEYSRLSSRRPASLASMLFVAVATLSFGRSALLRPPTPLLRHRAPVCTVSEAPEMDLVGDGGVLKRVLQAGNGDSPVKGTTVEVHYDGTLLSTGARFDSSRERGKVRSRAAGPAPHHRQDHHLRHLHHHPPPPQTFKFTLGEGKVIGGWEVGVASMKPGELSVLTCSPSYA